MSDDWKDAPRDLLAHKLASQMHECSVEECERVLLRVRAEAFAIGRREALEEVRRENAEMSPALVIHDEARAEKAEAEIARLTAELASTHQLALLRRDECDQLRTDRDRLTAECAALEYAVRRVTTKLELSRLGPSVKPALEILRAALATDSGGDRG